MTTRQEFTPQTKAKAFNLANGRCQKCTRRVGEGTKLKVEYHHALPCSLGGENTLDNCVVICVECHSGETATLKKESSKSQRLERKRAGVEKAKSQWAKRPFNQQFTPRVKQLQEI